MTGTRTGRWLATAVVALVVALVVPTTAWAVSPAPDYSWYKGQTSPYSIATANQWAGLVELVNGTASASDAGVVEDDFAGDVVNITTSMNFLNMDVKPAGGQGGKAFKGTLNGNGNTLSQFKVDTSAGVQNVGLIGAYAGPLVTGVNVGAGVSVTISQPAGGAVVSDVGLLAGNVTGSGAIQNCSNMGTITITSAVAQTEGRDFLVRNVGGLVGVTTGNVSGCSNEGSISITQSSTPRTENEQSGLVVNVGGIVGSLGAVDTSLSGGSDASHGSLSNCKNSATITVNTPSEAGKDRFGQIAYAQSYNIGGIAGYSRGSIQNSENSGYLACPRGSGVGGIVGGLRALTPSSSYSGNFTSEGTDDGMKDGDSDAIVVGTCSNSGDVEGFVFAAGIAGRAGTYTTVTDCLNGLTPVGANAGTYVVAHRWNKPFPAGIVGSTYGEVSYCANFASIASVSDFNHATHYISTQSGYYASGIAGNTSRFTDSNLTPTSPLPEVYGNYNVGNVLAVANMRQRALVGDNGGFVHDNVALQGCVSTNDLIYGDDPGESEASGGSSANNTFVTAAQLRGEAFLDEAAGTTVVSLLNNSAEADDWAAYWTNSNSASLNQGYPVLNRQVTWSRQDLAGATVAWAADAEYTGAASVPKASVSLNGTTLLQNVDFRVVPQPDGIEVTGGARSYTAGVEGIGSYAGFKANAFSYGMGKGDLANCTVAIDTQQYNAAAQDINASGVHVRNPAGNEVASGEFTVALDPNDSNLTDGQAIKAKKYATVITAEPSSPHFYGTNSTGVFNISTAKIICSAAGDTTAGNRAQPVGVSCMGKELDWYSNTAHPNATDADLRAAGAVLPYTGHVIKPSVTRVEFDGTTVKDGPIVLTEGEDYRIVYGETSIDTATESTDNMGKKGEVTRGYIMVRYVQGSNFSNYEIMTFLIDGTNAEKLDLADAEIKGPTSIIYEPEAGAYKPMTVWYGGSQLTEGVDYTIEYADNTDIGTATYVVKAAEDGLFTGQVTGSFDIVAGDPLAFSYTYNVDGTATVTGVTYNGTLDSYRLAIPGSVEHDGKTYAVTAIGDKAFGSNNSSELTESQRRIGSVEVPASVRSIGEWAFCTVNAVTFETSNITSVTFAAESQLATIGRGAFRNLGAAQITIPANVEAISGQAFARSSLKKVTFATRSAAIPEIAADAFQYVYRADAVYDESAATTLDGYVKSRLVGQNWTVNGQAVNAGSNEPVTPAKPAYTTWQRLFGNEALDTMNVIVSEGWDSADAVVLTTNMTYYDTLSASGIAGLLDAPVLMTAKNSLSPETAQAIARLKPSLIVVVGGSSVVSKAAVDAACAAAGTGTEYKWIYGRTASDTAAEVLKQGPAIAGKSWSGSAFVCTDVDFQDALSVAPIAFAKGMPIVLTDGGGKSLSDTSLSAMRAGGINKAYIIGGTGALFSGAESRLSAFSPERIFGRTGVDTSNAVAARALTSWGMSADKLGVATCKRHEDALSGAALCGRNGAVLCLVDDASSSTISGFIAANKDDIGTGYIFGGRVIVPQSVEDALNAATANHSNSVSAQSSNDLVAASTGW